MVRIGASRRSHEALETAMSMTVATSATTAPAIDSDGLPLPLRLRGWGFRLIVPLGSENTILSSRLDEGLPRKAWWLSPGDLTPRDRGEGNSSSASSAQERREGEPSSIDAATLAARGGATNGRLKGGGKGRWTTGPRWPPAVARWTPGPEWPPAVGGRAELSSASRLHVPSPVHTELAHVCAPHSVNHRVTFVIHASAQRRFIYRYELSDQTLVTWVNVN